MKKILIANRGEISVRIIRAAQELDIATVAICSADDAAALHCKLADQTVTLEGNGASAYLDIDQVINAAKTTDCDAIHPGYGFLAENAHFAEVCEQ
jgi:acetyl/propionyl-CoA carboxylase alpha subunit